MHPSPQVIVFEHQSPQSTAHSSQPNPLVGWSTVHVCLTGSAGAANGAGDGAPRRSARPNKVEPQWTNGLPRSQAARPVNREGKTRRQDIAYLVPIDVQSVTRQVSVEENDVITQHAAYLRRPLRRREIAVSKGACRISSAFPLRATGQDSRPCETAAQPVHVCCQ